MSSFIGGIPIFKKVICGWCKKETTLNFYREKYHCVHCNRLIDEDGKKVLDER